MEASLAPFAVQDCVSEIWVHMNPDIDEIIAIWILQNFGVYRFPDITSAEVKLVDPTQIKETYAELLSKKILCIGFSGGPFDEHPEDHDDGERIKGESAATLVARALGVREEPALQQIINYALEKDHSAATHEFELAPLVKTAYRYVAGEETNEEDRLSIMYHILEAAFLLLNGVWRKNKSFQDCRKEYRQSIHSLPLVKPNGKTLLLVSVASDNKEMQKFCRSREAGYAGVVVQRNTSGNTQIFFDHRQVDDDLVSSIARAIRIAERQANGIYGKLPHNELIADGSLKGADCWYVEKDKRLILNGSLTRSRPPTKLSREDIEAIVASAIKRHFEYVSQQL